MDENLKEEIKQLIARNKTEQAIKLLSSVQFSKADKDLIILNSRYNRVKEELMLNTISNEEAERKINKINLALLDLSNKMDGKSTALSLESGMSFNRQWLWLLLIPLAVLVWYFIPSGQATAEASNESVESPEGNQSTQEEASEEVSPPPPVVVPEPVKKKVRLTLNKMRVIKDGDDFTDFGGDFYWDIKANNTTIAQRTRNNNIELNDGDEHLFSESADFELVENGLSRLVFVANIIDADGGTSGGDDSIEITKTYNINDLNFPTNNIITERVQGDDGGNPSVELYWTLQLLPN